MKSRTLKCITAITLFAALAVPVRLAAQHTRHKPREIRTSGGPSSGSVAVGTHPLNNAVARGGAHTPTPDSNAPNCFGEYYARLNNNRRAGDRQRLFWRSRDTPLRREAELRDAGWSPRRARRWSAR